MTIAATMLPELVHEMSITRSLIERVPDAAAAWKPHPKSASMGELAIHLPGILSLVPFIVTTPELDFLTPAMAAGTPRWASASAALTLFDQVLDAARGALAGASDEELMMPFTLRAGDHTIFTLPRAVALRSFILSHIIHHRGQLSVYLRMNDVALPEIYGPNADSKR